MQDSNKYYNICTVSQDDKKNTEDLNIINCKKRETLK